MSRKTTHDTQIISMDVMATSSTQEMDLGSKVVSDNGEVFRYVKAGGTALVAGTLQQSPAEVANHTNITVAAAVAAGATTVTATLGATAATANQYAGGLMVVNDVDGQGFSYRIDKHDAVASAGVITLELEDEIKEALTTSSQITLVPNQYNGVIQNPTTATGVPVGVAITDIAANEYGFIQVWGPVACLNDGGTAIGLGVAPSGSVAGALATVAATTNQIGSAMTAGIDTEYRQVMIKIG